MNGIVIARDGEPAPVTLSDRLRPPGIGFGVGWIHVYPPSIPAEQLRAAPSRSPSTRCARSGSATRSPSRSSSPRRTAASRSSRSPRASPAARWPISSGTRSASTSSRSRSARRSARTCADDVALPRFVAAARDPLLHRRAGPAADGPRHAHRHASTPCSRPTVSCRPTRTSQVGETIRPVRRDGDRRGYVIATAETPQEALRRAELRRDLGSRSSVADMSCSFDLDHYRELLEAAKAGGYRFATLRRRRRSAATSSSGTTSTSRSTRRCGWRSSRRSIGVVTTYLLMTESVFYNLASQEGVAAIAAPPRARARGRPACRASERRARRALRSGRLLAQPEARVHVATIPGAVNAYAEPLLRAARRTAPTRTSTGAPAARTRSCAAAAFPWLQILVHPEIWVYPGRDDGPDDALDAERREGPPARAARRRRHRPRVTRPLRVVHCPVNTAGVPWANVQALRGRGVDAKLVVFNRYKLHSGGRLVARAPRRASSAGS